MERMGIRSLQGRPFTNLLLHNRFYLSHVFEEYAIAMLTQHGILCRMDRRQGHADIITKSGLRIEVKSSGSAFKAKRQGAYWDTYNVCDSCRDRAKKLTQSDFFMFISQFGKCVFIVPTSEIEKRDQHQFTIKWTAWRLDDISTEKHKYYKGNRLTSARFLWQYKDEWKSICSLEAERLAVSST